MDFPELVRQANRLLNPRRISETGWAGSVAAALLTADGSVFSGVCIDVNSGMGFCAEHAAIAAMVTAGKSRIAKIVAVGENGILPPCGRCREFISQIDDGNLETQVMVSAETIVPLKALLPYDPRTEQE